MIITQTGSFKRNPWIQKKDFHKNLNRMTPLNFSVTKIFNFLKNDDSEYFHLLNLNLNRKMSHLQRKLIILTNSPFVETFKKQKSAKMLK